MSTRENIRLIARAPLIQIAHTWVESMEKLLSFLKIIVKYKCIVCFRLRLFFYFTLSSGIGGTVVYHRAIPFIPCLVITSSILEDKDRSEKTEKNVDASTGTHHLVHNFTSFNLYLVANVLIIPFNSSWVLIE